MWRRDQANCRKKKKKNGEHELFGFLCEKYLQQKFHLILGNILRPQMRSKTVNNVCVPFHQFRYKLCVCIHKALD